MLHLGEYLSLEAENLPSALYLSSVQTPQPSSENLDMGEYLLLDGDNLLSAAYLSPVESRDATNIDWRLIYVS